MKQPATTAPFAKAPTRWQRGLSSVGVVRGLLLNERWADVLTAAVFLSPSVVVFGVFVLFPLAATVYISLTDWNFVSPVRGFVGLANYQALFTGERFWRVALNTLYYTASSISGSIVIALPLALVLNQKMRGRGFYRAAIFSPYVATVAAVALLWAWILDPHFGLMNAFTKSIGLPALPWLTSPEWAMPGIILMSVWRHLGYDMVILLAGLQAIPEEVYEAGRLDGAGSWGQFFWITLPLLTPFTFFLVVTRIITSFQVFDAVAVMTEGGPIDSTNVFVYYLYQQAFKYMEAGLASASATVLFLLILMLTMLQMRWSRRWVHYY